MRTRKQTWTLFSLLLLATTLTITALYALLTQRALEALIAGSVFGLIFSTSYVRATRNATTQRSINDKQRYKQTLTLHLQKKGFRLTKEENNTYEYKKTSIHPLLAETVRAHLTNKKATISGPALVTKRIPKQQRL